MIITTSIDNQLPAWTVEAGKVLIIMLVIGAALTIIRDIVDMREKWAACTRQPAGNCARGSNVPRPKTIPPMPKTIPPMPKTRIKLVKHKGVDIEEITLQKGKSNDCTAGERLDDDDKGQRH